MKKRKNFIQLGIDQDTHQNRPKCVRYYTNLMESFDSPQPADPLQHGWVLDEGHCVPVRYCRECLPEKFCHLEGRTEQQQSDDIYADINNDSDDSKYDTDKSDSNESDVE